MRTNLLAIALAATLAGCGGGGSGSYPGAGTSSGTGVAAPATNIPVIKRNTDDDKPPSANCHVVIYGDSLIADPLLTETMPASIARQRPAWTVVSRAVGGQTAAVGATILLNDTQPPGTVVVVEWGVNDLILSQPFAGPLDAFIKKKIEEKNKVVLTGIVKHSASGALWDNYNTQMLSLAQSNGTAYASWGELPITTFDGTHPDQPSTDALVEDLLNTLDKECPHD